VNDRNAQSSLPPEHYLGLFTIESWQSEMPCPLNGKDDITDVCRRCRRCFDGSAVSFS
jgi:hypothetical protein